MRVGVSRGWNLTGTRSLRLPYACGGVPGGYVCFSQRGFRYSGFNWTVTERGQHDDEYRFVFMAVR